MQSLNRRKDSRHMIGSMYTGKKIDKIQYFFMIKAVNKLRREGNYLNIIKAIIFSAENLKAFPLRSTRQGCPLLPSYSTQ
jgi:hypothetical protein